jgi:D-3-phosphoglycerate dehydrogenase
MTTSSATVVLVLERFDLEALGELRKIPGITVHDPLRDSQFASKSQIQFTDIPAEWAENVEVLAIRSKTTVGKDVLARFPKLKFIVTSTSGFDHIDLKLCRERGVQAAFTPEGNAISAAEITWSLILACTKRLPRLFEAVQKGRWERGPLESGEVHGKSLGIIGLGRIGQRVALLGRAFGMEILAYDPYADEEAFAKTQAGRMGYEELLRSADFISLHVPYTKETHHMINRQALELMTDETVLINASRGSVIDEQALAAVLQEGLIAYAGLDVFEREPLDLDSRLFKNTRLIMTPHVGALTPEALRRVSFEAVGAIKSFLAQTPVPNSLPPQANWYHEPKGYNS